MSAPDELRRAAGLPPRKPRRPVFIPVLCALAIIGLAQCGTSLSNWASWGV